MEVQVGYYIEAYNPHDGTSIQGRVASLIDQDNVVLEGEGRTVLTRHIIKVLTQTEQILKAANEIGG